jgi:CRISPR/Cas system-associated protein Cas10 (large subunit of type III CRISPR-Cas system)
LQVKHLKEQIQLRKEGMQKKIQIFIVELRKEIQEIWSQCMITKEEQGVFIDLLHSNQYTEQVLELHKEELKKWQLYHKKNLEILSKVKYKTTVMKLFRRLIQNRICCLCNSRYFGTIFIIIYECVQ